MIVYYFLGYLFLEIVVFVAIAPKIGVFWTFLEVIGSAFVGFFILANFRNVLFETMKALKNSKTNSNIFFASNLFCAIGAILLIVPGFLSDILGIILQSGFVGTWIANRLSKKYNQKKEEDIIDVEVIDYVDRP